MTIILKHQIGMKTRHQISDMLLVICYLCCTMYVKSCQCACVLQSYKLCTECGVDTLCFDKLSWHLAGFVGLSLVSDNNHD